MPSTATARHSGSGRCRFCRCRSRIRAARPRYGLRITIGRQVVAFSGDTEWTPALAEIAQGADLFICECYAYDRAIPHHLRYADLRRELPGLRARRVVLTHPGRVMLEHLTDIEHEVAEDGQEIVV